MLEPIHEIRVNLIALEDAAHNVRKAELPKYPPEEA